MIRRRGTGDWWRARPVLLDGLLALALAVLGLATLGPEVQAAREAGSDLEPVGVTAVLLLLCYTLPLALRRRSPLLAYGCVLTAASVAWATHYPALVGSLTSLVALYTVGVLLPRLRAFLLLLVTLAAYVLVTVVDAYDDTAWASMINAGVYAAAFAFGRATRYRRAYTSELETRATRLESERESDLRATLVEERSRIARELHDVVAHSLSVMTVQASAAQRTHDPVRSREAMAAVEATGRAALGEMRRIVGVLREDSAGGGSLAPSPGLADLPELVDKVQEAGLAVDLDLTPGPCTLPAGVDLAVYRIVQEALTNTLKHAGPSSACVRVACASDSVAVSVEDTGRGAAAAVGVRNGRTGHGLVGMQERVALYGGSLRAGPRPGGGYAVHARIPVDPATGPSLGRAAASP